jgi:hypothetical protein
VRLAPWACAVFLALSLVGCGEASDDGANEASGRKATTSDTETPPAVGIETIMGVDLPANDAEAIKWVRAFVPVYKEAYAMCSNDPSAASTGGLAAMMETVKASLGEKAAYVARAGCLDGLAGDPYLLRRAGGS